MTTNKSIGTYEQGLHQFFCGMFIKNTDGIYTWVSEGLLSLQRLRRDDILGRKDAELPWAIHARKLRAHDITIMANKRPSLFKETISRQGCTINGFCHKSPVFDDREKLVGIAGIFLEGPKFGGDKTMLSLREQQCLKNLALGMTAQQSALALGLSRRTVEGYLETLREKLHCKNQAELIGRYYRHYYFQS